MTTDLDVIWQGPKTEAGRALLDIIERDSAPVQGAWGPAIAMIEQEAARSVVPVRPPRCEEVWHAGFVRPLRCFGDAGHSGEHVW